MPKSSKIMRCIDCGKELPRKELNRKGRCRVCAIFKGIDTLTQLREHKGPEFEHWKKQTLAKKERYESAVSSLD